MKKGTSSLVLFLIGAAVFLLPVREYDYLRLRYFVGIWFFAEAAFLWVGGERVATPLYQLVGRFRSGRDKVVAGIALAFFFVILYLSVWLLMANEFYWAVKLALAIACVLLTWLVYYGICLLFGSPELRKGIVPMFAKGWFRRPKKR